MLNVLLAGLKDWEKQSSDRQKLQHTYLVSAVLLLVLAGLISLLDNNLGQNIAYLAFACIVAFVVNGIVWHLIVTNLVMQIKDRVVKK